MSDHSRNSRLKDTKKSFLIQKYQYLASKSRLILFVLIIYLFLSFIFYLYVSRILSPVDVSSITDEIVEIKPGMSASQIGLLLEDKDLIKNRFIFQTASILSGTSGSLKAGEYIINKNMGTLEILDKIAKGKSLLYKFTVPEGFTVSQIAEQWEENGFGKNRDFLLAATDESIIEKYKIDFDSTEGYLFPDTYMFPSSISESEAIREMLEQFWKISKELLDKKTDKYTEQELTLHEVISLASIIEREAMLESEKPIISAVFHNRLKRGRKLESCATVLYGLGYPKRKLTYEDLRNPKSLYNTYVYKGLPPGPICNPGLSSIAAALEPSEDKYLYFVSKNDGTHFFAETYRDFLNAKRKFQDG
ncbi:endolytic transglycosylase MltG [Candidatus Poribacteria bacterium]|nr:endolytic transglycosylase MltG [Candidatus Poribacteria bacterium]